MLKPKNFEQVQSYGVFIPLETGGHICRIMKVEESKSITGKEMVTVYLDTDITDIQPNYYSNMYKEDIRTDKKWSNNSVKRLFVYDYNGNTDRRFKTFIECVQDSNKGFEVQWNDKFENCFKGKLVGGVFGREEYENQNGEKKFAVKIQNFRTIQDVKKGIVKVPKDKLLNSSNDEELVPDNFGQMPF
ncbi:hypothetical protein [Clostridium botulinum]|uniref:hypothetical protein n=1 Tax=Clostridium botulinum TaxID=1491 RepID=UPI0006A6AC59|nr:hypothetical protein [Clostridium botulinum]KAI3350128.1 hypothetical protein CIT18_04425 [Clostridium botulinum]KOM88945.1 hypothetical protein ACP51_04210 [Clostridium botulinum]KOR63511.1 hypothetical protein ADT22_02995 [Clostridium botulinum]MCS6111524.1 hypothetical protein [Clostridium botulinum]NFE10944.1 hypothetical protein [Clostridium botulinum]